MNSRQLSRLFAVFVAALFCSAVVVCADARSDRKQGSQTVARPAATAKQSGGAAKRQANTTAMPSLESLIKTALRQHPEIRAAESKVRVAEAERDRIRLEVVQKVTQFRSTWEVKSTELNSAERELKRLSKIGTAVGEKLRVSAQLRVAHLQAELAAIEAQLPFMLGQTVTGRLNNRAKSEDGRRRKLLKDKLRPTLKRLVELTFKEALTGKTQATSVYKWSRRLMDVERELADTKAAKLAAVEAHRDRMKQLLKIVTQLYKAAQAGQLQVLASQHYAAEAELLLIDVR